MQDAMPFGWVGVTTQQCNTAQSALHKINQTNQMQTASDMHPTRWWYHIYGSTLAKTPFLVNNNAYKHKTALAMGLRPILLGTALAAAINTSILKIHLVIKLANARALQYALGCK